MGIPKEGVWHQLGEGQREKTSDKMDLRVNWNAAGSIYTLQLYIGLNGRNGVM